MGNAQIYMYQYTDFSYVSQKSEFPAKISHNDVISVRDRLTHPLNSAVCDPKSTSKAAGIHIYRHAIIPVLSI